MFGKSTLTTKPVITRKTIKSIAAGLYLGIAAFGLSISSAQATVILNVVGGELRGAQNVDLGSLGFVDFEFVDGTCIALFDGCNEPADFDFPSMADSFLAAEALRDQVFFDGALGNFDSNPDQVFGCTSSLGCQTLIPFAFFGGAAQAAAAFNSPAGDPNTAFFNTIQEGTDTGDPLDQQLAPFINYAKFTLGTTPPPGAAIPEPATLLLFGVGLAGLAAIRRRRRLR